MKISKQRLRQIIKEEVENAGGNFDPNDLQKSMSSSDTRSKTRDLGDRLGNSVEIDDKERNIIIQMMDLLEVASVELDIDKGDTYEILKRAYTLIAQVVQNGRESS